MMTDEFPRYADCPECGTNTSNLTWWRGERLCARCTVELVQAEVIMLEDLHRHNQPTMERYLEQRCGTSNLGEAQDRIDTRDFSFTDEQRRSLRRNMQKHGIPSPKREDWYHGVAIS